MRKLFTIQRLKSPKTVAFFVATIFIFFFFSLNIGINTDQGEPMTGCIFDQSLDCQMSIIEHISQWQQIFTTLKNIDNNLVFIALLLIAGVSFDPFYYYINSFFNLQFSLPRISGEGGVLTKLFDYILRSLSHGRLNPQIYHSS